MLIKVHEHEVLNAIAKSLPAASSVKKLVTVTGRAREEITEMLESLQKLQLLNVTGKNEVYLLKDGRTYLGLFDNEDKPATSNKTPPNYPTTKPHESLAVKAKDKPLDISTVAAELQSEQEVLTEIVKLDEPQGVLLSIEQLAEKLNQPAIEVSDIELKVQVLTRLAELLSDDIAGVLLDVKADLEKTLSAI